MKKLPSMVDMKMDSKEKEEYNTPSPPTYPYGLCISLCEDELEKLNLDVAEIGIGDMLHLHSLAKVTSVSCHDNEAGSTCRVELVLAYISAEDEDEENEDNKVTSKLYKK